jgi:hypothetical protein
LPVDHISELTLIALVRDRALWQPELIFTAELAPSARELQASFAQRGADEEHDSLAFVPDDPESVAEFLRKEESLTPVGQAALLTHGRHHYGAEWYDQTCLLLFGDIADVQRSG